MDFFFKRKKQQPQQQQKKWATISKLAETPPFSVSRSILNLGNHPGSQSLPVSTKIGTSGSGSSGSSVTSPPVDIKEVIEAVEASEEEKDDKEGETFEEVTIDDNVVIEEVFSEEEDADDEGEKISPKKRRRTSHGTWRDIPIKIEEYEEAADGTEVNFAKQGAIFDNDNDHHVTSAFGNRQVKSSLISIMPTTTEEEVTKRSGGLAEDPTRDENIYYTRQVPIQIISTTATATSADGGLEKVEDGKTEVTYGHQKTIEKRPPAVPIIRVESTSQYTDEKGVTRTTKFIKTSQVFSTSTGGGSSTTTTTVSEGQRIPKLFATTAINTKRFGSGTSKTVTFNLEGEAKEQGENTLSSVARPLKMGKMPASSENMASSVSKSISDVTTARKSQPEAKRETEVKTMGMMESKQNNDNGGVVTLSKKLSFSQEETLENELHHEGDAIPVPVLHHAATSGSGSRELNTISEAFDETPAAVTDVTSGSEANDNDDNVSLKEKDSVKSSTSSTTSVSFSIEETTTDIEKTSSEKEAENEKVGHGNSRVQKADGGTSAKHIPIIQGGRTGSKSESTTTTTTTESTEKTSRTTITSGGRSMSVGSDCSQKAGKRDSSRGMESASKNAEHSFADHHISFDDEKEGKYDEETCAEENKDRSDYNIKPLNETCSAEQQSFDDKEETATSFKVMEEEKGAAQSISSYPGTKRIKLAEEEDSSVTSIDEDATEIVDSNDDDTYVQYTTDEEMIMEEESLVRNVSFHVEEGQKQTGSPGTGTGNGAKPCWLTTSGKTAQIYIYISLTLATQIYTISIQD